MDIAAYLIHVVHIFAAVLAGGAIFHSLLAVRPALAGVDETQRAGISRELARRWFIIVQVLIALLLVTGLLNFVLIKAPLYRGHPHAGVYHTLFGVKFVLALGVFHVATVLALPGAKGDRYRAKAGFWLPYAAVLVTLVIIVASVLYSFTRFWGEPAATAP
ncbi:MAG: hypothetical protein AB7Q17_03230 [Phycisphaerae bacterium]